MGKLDLSWLLQQLFQQRRVWLQSYNWSNNFIKLDMQIKYVSDEVLMWVLWIHGMIWIVQKLFSFEIDNFSYLAVTKNDGMNRQNN